MRISDWNSDVCSSDLAQRVMHIFAERAIASAKLGADIGRLARLPTDIQDHPEHVLLVQHRIARLLDQRSARQVDPYVGIRACRNPREIGQEPFHPGLARLPGPDILDCGKGRSEEHTSELQSL